MKYSLITFRSVTPAQQAESALKRAGIGCTLQRTPRWMEEQGCGYSLRLRPQDVPRCVSLLRGRKLNFRKAYLCGEDGAVEEMQI